MRHVCSLVALVLIASAACAAAPVPDVPAAVGSAGATVPAPPANGAGPTWWHALGDPVMAVLVDRAVADSPAVELAAARLDRARAAARATRAALLPGLQAGGGATAIGQSLEDPIIRPFAGFPGFQRDVERYDASLSASWELDLFGAAPRRRAARAGMAAAQAEVAAARVLIAAETATAYLNVRELQERVAIANVRVANLARQREALRRRVAAGTVAGLDLDRFAGEAEAASAAVPALEVLVAAETARLGVLVGDAQTARMLTANRAGAVLPTAVSLDALNIDIARRPDVVAAAARLAVADAGIALARAQRFPKLSLAGLLATVASAPAALFTGAAAAAQGSARVSLPLLDFGRIDAAVADARGARREALASYRQVLLQAAADIEVATVTLARRQAEAERQANAASALARAEAAATATYEAGALDLTALLDTQRTSLAAREAAVIAHTASARALVGTIRASATIG